MGGRGRGGAGELHVQITKVRALRKLSLCIYIANTFSSVLYMNIENFISICISVTCNPSKGHRETLANAALEAHEGLAANSHARLLQCAHTGPGAFFTKPGTAGPSRGESHPGKQDAQKKAAHLAHTSASVLPHTGHTNISGDQAWRHVGGAPPLNLSISQESEVAAAAWIISTCRAAGVPYTLLPASLR